MPRGRRSHWYAAVFALGSASCDPLIDVAGAFFPAWILCILVAIAATALLRLLFARIGVESGMRPLAVVYACLAIGIAFGCWVLFFRR